MHSRPRASYGNDSMLFQHGSVNPSYYDNFDRIDPVDSPEPQPNGPPRKIPQIFAAFSATLSALSCGVILGWTNPIFDYLLNGEFNDIPIDQNQLGWIGSLAVLGAMITCVPTGLIVDWIGSKNVIVLLIVPFSLGWISIIFAKTILGLYVGRFALGMAVGSCCVAAPIYVAEIAHRDLRGALGSLFQLMVVIGIFVVYLLGKYTSPFNFTITCALIPVAFLATIINLPNSPTYLIKMERFDEARQVLTILRGRDYNIEEELERTEVGLKEQFHSSTSYRAMLSRGTPMLAVIISFTLMGVQQLCGINAIVLYSSNIIKSANVHIDENTGTILLGAFQVLATMFSSLIIERVGRKFLLFVSLLIVTATTMILAVYLTLKPYLDPYTENTVSFLPFVSLCFYVIAFSLGLGPIPWMITCEIVPPQMKNFVASASATINWFLAFIITKIYTSVPGQPVLFYVFSAFSLLGTIFVLVIVPETKQRTIREIHEEMSAMIGRV